MRYFILILVLSSFIACNTARSTARSAPSKTKTTIGGKRQGIVQSAQKLSGSKYKYGGTTPKGFDCSGFVQYVFAQNGVSLPRTTKDLSKYGIKVPRAQLQPGDLLFFQQGKGVNHVAIVVSANSRKVVAIHSTSSRGVMSEDIFASTYWEPRYIFARSVL